MAKVEKELDGIDATHSYPSYSQSGEDRIAFYYFGARELNYVDIGASSPCGHNNTYLFYGLGGKGLLVDAELGYFDSYKAIRPNDLHIHAAVVPEKLNTGEIKFYQTSDQGWSTVSETHLELAKANGKAHEGNQYFLVPTRSIADILTIAQDHFGSLDLMSIDIEGMDWEVLKELGDVKPKMIIVENSSENLPLKGYGLYARTPSNLIFLREDSHD